MKNPPIKEGFSFKSSFLLLWCPRPDSNRHGLFSQRILSPSCLPIPSPGHNIGEASAGFEPANGGFANRSLRPLGYDAI